MLQMMMDRMHYIILLWDGKRSPRVYCAGFKLMTQVVEDLIKLGMEVHTKDKQVMTPLHYAVKLGNHNIADHLLQAGAHGDEAYFKVPLPEWFVAMQLRKLALEQKEGRN